MITIIMLRQRSPLRPWIWPLVAEIGGRFGCIIRVHSPLDRRFNQLCTAPQPCCDAAQMQPERTRIREKICQRVRKPARMPIFGHLASAPRAPRRRRRGSISARKCRRRRRNTRRPSIRVRSATSPSSRRIKRTIHRSTRSENRYSRRLPSSSICPAALLGPKHDN